MMRHAEVTVEREGTLVAIQLDAESPEDVENRRLRELAQSSGPAGDGSLLPDLPVSGQGIDEPGGDESTLEAMRRHGSNAVLTLGSLTGLVKEEHDPSRMRTPRTARAPRGEVVFGGGIPDDLLDDVRPIDDVHGRDPDMVLMDWMGDETGRTESGLLTDLNPTDEQIDYAVRRSRGEELTPVVPDTAGGMRADFDDYNRFGGDVVAMEMDRRDLSEGSEYRDGSEDAMLQALMESEASYGDFRGAREGLAALREDLGRDIRAEVLGTEGTTTVYRAYSPEIGQVRYSYDSVTGVGRIVGRE